MGQAAHHRADGDAGAGGTEQPEHSTLAKEREPRRDITNYIDMEPVDSKIIACRNCKSPKILRLANSAYVYPFFAYRVWGIRSASMGADRCQTAIIMDGVICEECGFLSTWIEIPEVCLGGLYKDYRSPTYNQERGYFEPGYVENIAKHIGGPSEALNRVAALDDYFQRLQLKGLFSQESILLALDWGGADGRFMPTLNKTTKKFVYEISDKPSIDNVIKKTELCNDDRFDIIVVAHVLEHVSNPNDFLGTAVNHIADGGYLYLEVPLEVKNPETIVEDAKSGRVPYEVHEHINKYTLKSLQYLALSHGLKIIDLTTEEIDFSWTKASVIRLLAHKCSNFHDES